MERYRSTVGDFSKPITLDEILAIPGAEMHDKITRLVRNTLDDAKFGQLIDQFLDNPENKEWRRVLIRIGKSRSMKAKRSILNFELPVVSQNHYLPILDPATISEFQSDEENGAEAVEGVEEDFYDADEQAANLLVDLLDQTTTKNRDVEHEGSQEMKDDDGSDLIDINDPLFDDVRTG